MARTNHRVAISHELQQWQQEEDRVRAKIEDIINSSNSTDHSPAKSLDTAMKLEQSGNFNIPCAVLLPDSTKTFQKLVDEKHISSQVAEDMHKIWFSAQKRFVSLEYM